MYIDLTQNLIEKMKSRSRVRGRYNSSELYAILNGWVTPETWMNPKERLPEELIKMWKGIYGHEAIQYLLKKNLCEIKKEVRYKGITLVGKADYLPDGDNVSEVWEFKTSEEVLDSSKPWHDYQARLYTTMFDRPKGVVLQPIETSTQIMLKAIGEVHRNDEWFKAQMEELYNFHLKVEEIWNNQ